MPATDKTIYAMHDGKMTHVAEPTMNCESVSFLIVCRYGDWSGFRTLAECEAQFAELEANEKQSPDRGYRVVQR